MNEELEVKIIVDASKAQDSISDFNKGLDEASNKIDNVNRKSLNRKKASIDTSGLGLEELKQVRESLGGSKLDSSILQDIDSKIGAISSTMDSKQSQVNESKGDSKGNILGSSGKLLGAILGIKGTLDLIKKLFHDNENMQAALNNLFLTLGGLLAPIIDFIAKVINTIASLLASIFKINKKTSASTGSMAKSLAGFDEINNLANGSGGASGVASEVDPGTIGPLETLLKGVWDIISGLFEMVAGFVGAIYFGLMQIGQLITETILVVITIGLSTISGIVAGLFNGIAGFLAGVIEGIVNIWNNIKQVFELVFADGYQFGDVITAVLLSLLAIVTGLIGTIWNSLKGLLVGLWDGFKAGFKTVWDFLNKTLLEPIAKSIENIWNKATKPALNLIIGGFEKIVNGFIGIVNSVIGAINKIPGVNIGYLSTKSIPRLAEGGTVNSGQLFIANEQGPELVGRYGSKTGVMNNEQIVSAVSEGVYNAVIEASKENNQEIVLTMDGLRVAKSVVKNINMMNRIAGGSVIG